MMLRELIQESAASGIHTKESFARACANARPRVWALQARKRIWDGLRQGDRTYTEQ